MQGGGGVGGEEGRYILALSLSYQHRKKFQGSRVSKMNGVGGAMCSMEADCG